MSLINFVFLKLRTPVSEDASTSNMVKLPKHSWNLYHSTFSIFIGHWQGNCVRKSLIYWNAAFLKSRLSFEHFEIKDHPHSFCISEMRTLKTWLDKCLKRLFSEDPSTSNMVNVPKHCWNLHHSTFIIFIDHCQGNWVGKSLSYWHAKSWDCLLTHWLPMKSILFFIGTISWYQFISNYLRNRKLFLNFLLLFWNVVSILNNLNKRMTFASLLTHWLQLKCILFLKETI